MQYNKALYFAESDLQLSLLYANRSVVYLIIKKYKECLENIKLAKKLGYPKEKMSKLVNRESSCYWSSSTTDFNKNDKIVESFFKLSYKSHPTIPFIIDGIELRRSEEFGRHLITTRDIKPGDIIAIEEPIIKVNMPGVEYKRCARCLRENNLILIPCKDCTTSKFRLEMYFIKNFNFSFYLLVRYELFKNLYERT